MAKAGSEIGELLIAMKEEREALDQIASQTLHDTKSNRRLIALQLAVVTIKLFAVQTTTQETIMIARKYEDYLEHG